MIPSSPNAFLGLYPTPDGHPRGSLAGLLAAMRATLAPTGFGYQLHLQPLRFTDVMPLWSELGDGSGPAGPSGGTHHGVTTLLVDLGSMGESAGEEGLPLAAHAARYGLTGAAAFGEEALALDDEALTRVADMAGERSLAAVRVAGPIEARDAEAMTRALRRGDSPLDFECRAFAALYSGGPRSIRLEVTEPAPALRVVAEAFRHYIAALRKRDVPAIAPPEAWQVQRLLEIAGEISVRPIETEIFTTAIDVGICVEAGGPTRPAGRSLIYDVFSNTWHDEP
jgi:hypothetical protein